MSEVRGSGVRRIREWLPLLALALALGVFFSPISLHGPRYEQQSAFGSTKSSTLSSPYEGTWRSVGEKGFPDVTFHSDGSVSFSGKSSASTASGGCSTEDVKRWRVIDKSHLEFSGNSAARDVEVTRIDKYSMTLSDSSGGSPILLVRKSVFDAPPVILIHGINDKPEDCWKYWFASEPSRVTVADDPPFTLEWVRTAYFGPQVPVFILGYSGSGDNTHADIFQNTQAVPWAIDKVKAVCRQKGEVAKPFLVAHSLGGLLSRSYMESLPAKFKPSVGVRAYKHDVMGLVTIGTPHGGTWISSVSDWSLLTGGPLTSIAALYAMNSGPAGQQMDKNSSFIGQLNSVDMPDGVKYGAAVGVYSEGTLSALAGDGVVSEDAQFPYRAGKGGGTSRSTWFTQHRDVSYLVRYGAVHFSGYAGDPTGHASIPETWDDQIADWVVARYKVAAVSAEKAKP